MLHFPLRGTIGLLMRILKWTFLMIFLSTFSSAEPLKTVFNPFTGKQDYITRIDSNTIIPGTNVTVGSNANGTVTVNSTGGGSGTPGGSNQQVQYNNGGSFGGTSFLNITSTNTTSSADVLWTSNAIGPVLTDANSCTWRTTVTIAGNLVTTLLACPTPVVPVPYRKCIQGEPIGLLLGLVCGI